MTAIKTTDELMNDVWKWLAIGYTGFGVMGTAWTIFSVESGIGSVDWSLFALVWMIPWVRACVRLRLRRRQMKS